MKALLLLGNKKIELSVQGYEISHNIFVGYDLVINLGFIPQEVEKQIEGDIQELLQEEKKPESIHKPSKVGVLIEKSAETAPKKRFLLSAVNSEIFGQLSSLRQKRGVRILDTIPSVVNMNHERILISTKVYDAKEEGDAIIKAVEELLDKESKLTFKDIFIESPIAVCEDGPFSFYLEESVIVYDLEEVKEIK